MLHGAFWNKEHATVPGYESVLEATVPEGTTHVYILGVESLPPHFDAQIDAVFATEKEARDARSRLMIRADRDSYRTRRNSCDVVCMQYPYFILRISIHDSVKPVRSQEDTDVEDSEDEL